MLGVLVTVWGVALVSAVVLLVLVVAVQRVSALAVRARRRVRQGPAAAQGDAT
ncbi:MAG TPA: hypothetical protein VNU26_02230 [Mycobacteriales bacterium]|nr:hypothetical protein [Mycobacteriales bacterium]